MDEYLANTFSSAAIAQFDPQQFEELAFECGSAWGDAIVAAIQWKWVRVKFSHPRSEAIGVASADASLVIYPFQTIFLYFEQVLPVRVLKSFEVLSEPGRVPMLPPGGLENVMDHIP